MQAHDQEEMFMGHNEVGWSSNPGKCGIISLRNAACKLFAVLF